MPRRSPRTQQGATSADAELLLAVTKSPVVRSSPAAAAAAGGAPATPLGAAPAAAGTFVSPARGALSPAPTAAAAGAGAGASSSSSSAAAVGLGSPLERSRASLRRQMDAIVEGVRESKREDVGISALLAFRGADSGGLGDDDAAAGDGFSRSPGGAGGGAGAGGAGSGSGARGGGRRKAGGAAGGGASPVSQAAAGKRGGGAAAARGAQSRRAAAAAGAALVSAGGIPMSRGDSRGSSRSRVSLARVLGRSVDVGDVPAGASLYRLAAQWMGAAPDGSVAPVVPRPAQRIVLPPPAPAAAGDEVPLRQRPPPATEAEMDAEVLGRSADNPDVAATSRDAHVAHARSVLTWHNHNYLRSLRPYRRRIELLQAVAQEVRQARG